MHAGFDYGTSHCSIGVPVGDGVRLLPVENDETQIPSTLFVDRPDEGRDHAPAVLDLGDRGRLRFGRAALAAYLADPDGGYFVKSPKSFLGAPGLNVEVTERFIGVVAAMMGNVKQRAEQCLRAPIEQVVIGRPINFQGAKGERENHQALGMLVAAARECGFEHVTFLYEPVAAALEFEARLTREMRILVVDVGGGTTDCSLVRVGPERRSRRDREADVLGHAGERLGGNDYDQMLALKTIMPTLGFGDLLGSGLPIPNTYFVDAVTTNDVNAQQRFYSEESRGELARFAREAQHPERIARLGVLQRGRHTHRLLGAAEAAKIDLTDAEHATSDLGFIEQGLTARASRRDLELASERLLDHLSSLLAETARAAGSGAELVYLTGGMSKSTVVRRHLEGELPNLELVDSDHFGSVTQGLTLWAGRMFGEG